MAEETKAVPKTLEQLLTQWDAVDGSRVRTDDVPREMAHRLRAVRRLTRMGVVSFKGQSYVLLYDLLCAVAGETE